jgi:hypothetical protein
MTVSNGCLNFNRPFNNRFKNRRCAMLATEFPRQRDDYTTDMPPCPNCGRAMHLIRTVPRAGDSDLCAFKCGECAVWLTEPADKRCAI